MVGVLLLALLLTARAHPQARVTMDMSNRIAVFPSPAFPTATRTMPGTLSVEHQPAARQWLVRDRAGIVVNLSLRVPDTGQTRCKVAIRNKHAVLGGDIAEGECADILAFLPPDSRSVCDIDIYWNGTSKWGTRMTPGVYTVRAEIEYTDGSGKQVLEDDVRIDSPHATEEWGQCGQGCILALVVPVAVRFARRSRAGRWVKWTKKGAHSCRR